MAKRLLRKALSAPGLLRVVRGCFDEVKDPGSGRRFSLSDCLMSGLAVFGLKYPSLLRFDRDARTDEVVRTNLSSLYGVERAPCDTALRERLDEVDPRALRGVFKRVFAQLQRGKGLEGFTCLDGHYLLSVDGTGYFSSSSVHCKHCCEKHHKDGRITYSHQMLAFLIDQCQQRGCALFQAARHKAERARYFWERVRVLFLTFPRLDWETLYQAIAFGYHGELVVHDTS